MIKNDGQSTGIAIVAVIVIAGLSVGAAYMVMSDGDSGGGGGENISLMDKVPGNSQFLGSVDASSVLSDSNVESAVNTLLENYFTLNNGATSEPYDIIIGDIENELGLSLDKLNSVSIFGTYGQTTTSSDMEENLGLIFDSEYSENEFVTAVASEDDEVTENIYKDVTMYVISPEISRENSQDTAVGVLPDGTYTLGLKSTVMTVIDTIKGDVDSISGTDLGNQFAELEDKYVKVSADYPADQVPQQIPVENIEYVSMTFTMQGDSLVLDLRLKPTSQGSATDIENNINSLLQMVKQQVPIESLKDEIDKVDVSTDGDLVVINYETTAADLAKVISALSSNTPM